MCTKSFLLTLLLLTSTTAAPLSTLRARSGVFGTCSNPTIEFANGLDGRNEPSFAPVNSADFNHGSALNIGVIASFICGQLQSKCKADASAITACSAATQAASAATGQAAADAFNSAINAAGSQSASANTASSASSASSGTNAQGSQSTTNQSTASSTAAASSGNLQTFTGSLGGLPPPVSAGGKGFIVDGSQFIQEAGALGRSCDVQHNACANAANSGSSNFSVADCDTQNQQCHATI